MTGLAHRIWSQCGEELDLFLDQVHALSKQEIGTGGLDCAATAMGRRRSITSDDVSVDVVGFVAQSPGNGASGLGVSVALRFHNDGSISQHHWDEAHAWAGAVAGGSWMAAEFIESVETPGGVVFHYSLIEDQIPYYSWTPPESRCAGSVVAAQGAPQAAIIEPWTTKN